MNDDKLTVIISAWKAAAFLDECLKSFDGVECVDEILLGVDGCEETRLFVENNASRYGTTKFYNAEMNGGNYLMYNALVPLARNEHVLIFGADDVALPAIAGQFRKLKNEVDIIFHCFHVLSHKIKIITAPKKLHPSGGVICFRKCLFDEIGGFSPWRCAADTEFTARAARNNKRRGFIQEAMFLRRSHINQITTSKDYGRGSDARAEYARLIAQFRADNILKVETQSAKIERIK